MEGSCHELRPFHQSIILGALLFRLLGGLLVMSCLPQVRPSGITAGKQVYHIKYRDSVTHSVT